MSKITLFLSGLAIILIGTATLYAIAQPKQNNLNWASCLRYEQKTTSEGETLFYVENICDESYGYILSMISDNLHGQYYEIDVPCLKKGEKYALVDYKQQDFLNDNQYGC